MLIEPDIKLNYSDVLIRPKRTSLDSRAQVNLIRTFVPKYGSAFEGVPIIAANMATGTFKMLDAFAHHGLFVAVAKYASNGWYGYEDPDFNIMRSRSDFGFYTIGMSNHELEQFDRYYNEVKRINAFGIKTSRIKLCVDIANGYSQKFASFISKIREKYPEIVIVAGNVVTSDMTQELILGGADYVKVGIGPGCLGGDTRVLMANGTYKSIRDVKLHDRVINGHGMPVDVIGVKYSGMRKVKKYKNNLFYRHTLATPDHKHMVGDYGSFAASLQSCNLQECLHKLTRFGDSKFHWDNIEDNFKNKTLVMPMKISFEMPESFLISMDDYAHASRGFSGASEITKKIEPSYELGYLIGTFIGDGCSGIYTSTRVSSVGNITKNTGSNLSWYYGKDEIDIAQKTINCMQSVFNVKSDLKTESNMQTVRCRSNVMARFFAQFYDNKQKYIPSKYLVNNTEYLRGILDGMVDSDGSYYQDGRIGFGNTSEQLIETFGIIFYMIHGYFPSMQMRGKSAGTLTNVNLDNCNDSFVCRSVTIPQSNDYKYQINRVYNEPEDVEFLVPTYDIEVDCDSHSFIANNSVVHNSKCSTRLKTGVGYPQLSAIIECADAAHGLGAGIIADGGIRSAGDVGKALCANADMVMIGGMFAGTDECDGEVIERHYRTGEVHKCCVNGIDEYEDIIETKKFKLFYGMSSEYAQKKHMGEMKEYRASEGFTEEVPYIGPVENVIKDIMGGLRSTGTYIGANDVKNFGKCATFIRTNQIHDKF
jgi:IMP dehydrogenase/GMP reductase